MYIFEGANWETREEKSHCIGTWQEDASRKRSEFEKVAAVPSQLGNLPGR